MLSSVGGGRSVFARVSVGGGRCVLGREGGDGLSSVDACYRRSLVVGCSRSEWECWHVFAGLHILCMLSSIDMDVLS